MFYIYNMGMLIAIFYEHEEYSNWLWQLDDQELDNYQIVYVEKN